MVKTGLLILTNPAKIASVLPSVVKYVNNTLYIHWNPHNKIEVQPTEWPLHIQTVDQIYYQASVHCQNLDVRVLLSGIKNPSLLIETYRKIEILLFDKYYNENELESWRSKLHNIEIKCPTMTLSSSDNNNDIITKSSSFNMNPNPNPNLVNKVYEHVVLGGTFDRLHNGHKILLNEGVLRSTRKLTVGVTETNLLLSKKLWELIQPCSERINNVKNYLQDIDSSLIYDVVPIDDPFGPAKDDPHFQMLVASEETIARARTVNDLRVLNNVRTLELYTVPLISNGHKSDEEEDKISSSNIRMRLLGTRLKPPIKPASRCSHAPYVVGLTGGIASGKSTISMSFMELGAGRIDCDKIAHELYRPGTKLNTQIIETFGKEVALENNEINRKVLGSIVFNDKAKLEKLNNLIWPAIAEECIARVKKLHEEGFRIIIVEAAILLKAGWDRFCNEIWVCVIPLEEAVKRLIERNHLTEEDARSRLSSQPSNTEYVQAANIIFSTFWSRNFTQKQVETAWKIIQNEVLEPPQENCDASSDEK